MSSRQPDRPSICLVGPMLGCHPGWVVTQGEILAELLAERGYRVHATSTLVQPVLRLIDMVGTLIGRRRSIDIVALMVFSGRGFMVAEVVSWLARRLGKPLICCLHGGNLPDFAQRHPRWIARVMQRATVLVAPSRYLATQLPDWGVPMAVVPNVVRLERYPFQHRHRVRPRLLWMRTFHPYYAPELALEVFARLRQRYPEAKLTMGGQDAGLLAAVRDRAKALGLEQAVRFAGFLDRAAKEREFNDHDIFINTNSVDNMPVSVIEAAAFGLPVVATAVGGIPYLLRDGENALLVESGDAAAMDAAIERLLSEPGLASRLSEAGRSLAEESDWPAVAPQWDELFARIHERAAS